MKRIIKIRLDRFLLLAAFIVLLTLMGISAPLAAEKQSEDALEDVVFAEKLIRIRGADDGVEGEDVRTENRARGLRVYIRSDRSSYRKGDAIRLKVKSNKSFYLYLININPRTGRGVAILPNRIQTDERIKYPGDNKWRHVPNKNLEFYGDRRGKERIIMIASRRYLDVDRLLSKARSRSLGDFFEMEEPLDSFDEVIAASYGEKSIKIRSKKSRLPRGVVIKELNLRIR